MNKFSVYKKTTDNFCGNYMLTNGDQLVNVTFHGNISPPNHPLYYRVSVWGNDDLGFEYDTDSESDAYTKFMLVIGLENITFDLLRDIGFVFA